MDNKLINSTPSIDDIDDDENIIVENEPEPEDITQEIHHLTLDKKEDEEDDPRKSYLIAAMTEEEIKNIPTRFENALLLNEEVKQNKNKDESEFIITPRPKIAPFLLFINPKSGGQLGDSLFKSFKEHLHHVQVRDLASEKGPKKGLSQFSNVPNTRVIACGGDGTAGWVLSILDTMNINPRPPVGVIPLGTGNDLARTLGWGGGFDKVKASKEVLNLLAASEVVQLDRWKITFNGEVHGYLPVINNYFSIGIDAKIALKFHEKREANPENFNSQTMNKIKYGAYGALESAKGLQSRIQVEIDGKEIKLPKIEGIIVLNLPSWAGGTDLWNFRKADEKKGWKENKVDDGLFEVVGIKSSFHIGEIKGHLSNAVKLGQGSKLKITLKETDFCQIDGEPWKEVVEDSNKPCVIEINHFNRVPMLSKSSKKKGPSSSKHHEIEQPTEEHFDTDLKGILVLNHQVVPNDKDDKVLLQTREGTTPFLTFINPLSGGQLGDALFKSLRKYLHQVQVWALGKNSPPNDGLECFAKINDTRVIACGGDGTAGWVLSSLDAMKLDPRPPVGVIPLGTGNDLARTLGWGGGFDKVNTMKHLLMKLEKAEIVHLDRWKVTFNGEVHGYLPVMNNYFSIGIDAKIAYKFHEKREANPENFNSQTMNKIKYGAYGATESVKNLEKDFIIKIDDKEIKVPKIEGIIVLNLPSWAGGTDLWNFSKADEKKGWKENKIDDGLFEVVGIKSSMHIARIKGKISRGAIKIGQGKKLQIMLNAEHYCQIDGEPWKQGPCTIDLVHFNRVPMLKKKDK